MTFYKKHLKTLTFLLLFPPAMLFSQSNFQHSFLIEAFDANRFCQVPLNTLKIQQVDSLLNALTEKYPVDFQFAEAGRSVQDRPIYLAKLGSGSTKALLWSQMHGDEPTATAALFDIFNYLLQNAEDDFAKTILENLTILAVPMLNPDGAEQFQRRNAQGLDINRDARDLQSPEARLLKQLAEQYQPDFGFNLHDQDQRHTVGNTNQQVAMALMAPPFDTEQEDNPVRTRAKQLVAVIYQSLQPYLCSHIAKYEGDYMPRAFGDSMQRWGVSTVLIESGGWHTDRNNFLQKMNFVAILSALRAIADGSFASADSELYEQLLLNDKNLFDLIIRDVTLIDGTGIAPFRTDVAINYNPIDKQDPNSELIGTIAEYGDLEGFAAQDTILGDGCFLTPGFIGILPEYSSNHELLAHRLDSLLQQGFTTILLPVRQGQVKDITALQPFLENRKYPGNIGALLLLESEVGTVEDTLHVLNTLQKGFIGLYAADSSIKSVGLSDWVGKAYGYPELSSFYKPLTEADFQRINQLTLKQAKRWLISQRGKIRPSQFADLILFSIESSQKLGVRMIFVKGHIIYSDGQLQKARHPGEYWLPD
jgi:hypothetical protein